MSLLLALSLSLAMQAEPAQAVAETKPDSTTITLSPTDAAEPGQRIDQAMAAMKGVNPADALPIRDAIIAKFERAHPANPDLMVFSASNTTQTLMYAVIPATKKKNGIVVDGSWSLAHFLKGFLLIDLQRSDEALAQFDRAVALSPMDSQFLGERGEWYKSHKQWDNAYADFASAVEFSTFSDEQMQVRNKGRGLRGMAFALVEKGDLKGAQKLLKQALKLDPNDAVAHRELDYIKGRN